jgi:hypothetical protein
MPKFRRRGSFGYSPLSHRGDTPIPSWYPYPQYTSTVVAGAILLGFLSLGTFWFRRRLAETFSLPVGQFSDETSNARGPSPGSKTGLPLQCTRLDTVSSPGVFRVSSPARGDVPFPMQGAGRVRSALHGHARAHVLDEYREHATRQRHVRRRVGHWFVRAGEVRIAGRRGDASVEYSLIDNAGRWAVYDVTVDGVSLVSSYRSQFNSILRKSSFTALLERLQSREAGVIW